MSNQLGQIRAVAICLRDFEEDIESIAIRLKSVRFDFRKKGSPHGTQKNHSKNFLILWHPFYACEPWEKNVSKLIEQIGGFECLTRLLKDVGPAKAWLQIRAPLNGSPYVETAFLSQSLVEKIASIGLGIDVAVLDFDDREITHHPAPSTDPIH